MSSSSDSTQESETSIGKESLPGFGYGLGLSIGVLVLFLLITYVSYKCKRPLTPQPTEINNPSFFFNNNSISLPTANIQHNGLDAETLASCPLYTYSQIKLHKSESTSSACSVCLADYKDGDLIRLLPECGHLFHRSCVDPWLMTRPTCPICRSSPSPQVEPVATR